jgi:hypothetical protein
MVMKRQSTWERKILRGMYGPVVEQGIFRIRTNGELMVLYKDLDVLVDIKQKILEWIGHVVRMDQGTTVNLLAPELFFKFYHILYIKCE